MVEILFGIAAKIKYEPQYLHIWFRPKAEPECQRQGDKTLRPRPSLHRQEFPLFYHFLNFIHLDTTAGEFSRTGLIYIIESAHRDEALERWIIESDLGTLMASGLGASYSQLSRKLALSQDNEQVPTIFALSGGRHPAAVQAIRLIASKNDKDLSSFLVFLAFWQDILEYCSSTDVQQTLLDHFEHIFMQQVLYPSMLESSDKDGGSAVAIMTYVRFIIESITHLDLIRVFLQFLLATHATPVSESSSKPPRPATLARRRKSRDLLDAEARSQDRLVPNLFNLVDLVLSSLRSCDQQTVAATLQLVSALAQTHYPHALSSFLSTQKLSPESTKYSSEAYERNVDCLAALIANFGVVDESPELIELRHQDAQHLIESHCTTPSMLYLPTEIEGGSSVMMHTIPIQNPLLKCLLSLLERFFLNDISTNLFLTQTLLILTCCGRCSLKGWLLTDYHSLENVTVTRSTALSASDAQSGTSQIVPLGIDNTAIPTPRNSPFVAAFDHLVSQVTTFRSQIPDFDIHLSEQKHAFNVWDQMAQKNTASSQRKAADRSSHPPATISTNDRSQATSIPLRLRSSAQSSLSPSRSGSPRGRKSTESHLAPGSGSTADTLNQLRLPSASPGPLKPDQRAAGSSTNASPVRRNAELSTKSGVRSLHLEPSPDAMAGIIPHVMVKVPVADRAHIGEADGGRKAGGRETDREIPLRQVLTNVIILREFIFELMAVIEVRASLFGEVVMD